MREVDFSSRSSRPFASLIDACTPCGVSSRWPGTVHVRSSVPSADHSNTFEGMLSPSRFV